MKAEEGQCVRAEEELGMKAEEELGMKAEEGLGMKAGEDIGLNPVLSLFRQEKPLYNPQPLCYAKHRKKCRKVSSGQGDCA